MELKSPTEKPVHVALLSGHTILIPPEGRTVSEMFRQQAFINGAIPVNSTAAQMSALVPPPSDKSKEVQIIEGVKKMLEDDCKLTGSGMPNLNELSGVVGFRVTAEELTAAWHVLELEAKQ